MTVRADKVEKTVATEWQTTTSLTCDHCGATVQVSPPIYGNDRPNPAGWYVLKAWDVPPWYDLECVNTTVRHFDSLTCLTAWSAAEAGSGNRCAAKEYRCDHH